MDSADCERHVLVTNDAAVYFSVVMWPLNLWLLRWGGPGPGAALEDIVGKRTAQMCVRSPAVLVRCEPNANTNLVTA